MNTAQYLREHGHEITVWYAVDVDGREEYNHYSDGYVATARRPVPINRYQEQSWKNKAWWPARAVLCNGVVIEHPEADDTQPVAWTGEKGTSKGATGQ